MPLVVFFISSNLNSYLSHRIIDSLPLNLEWKTNYKTKTMLYIIFQYGLEPVLLQQIFFGFEVTLGQRFQYGPESDEFPMDLKIFSFKLKQRVSYHRQLSSKKLLSLVLLARSIRSPVRVTKVRFNKHILNVNLDSVHWCIIYNLLILF